MIGQTTLTSLLKSLFTVQTMACIHRFLQNGSRMTMSWCMQLESLEESDISNSLTFLKVMTEFFTYESLMDWEKRSRTKWAIWYVEMEPEEVKIAFSFSPLPGSKEFFRTTRGLGHARRTMLPSRKSWNRICCSWFKEHWSCKLQQSQSTKQNIIMACTVPTRTRTIHYSYDS